MAMEGWIIYIKGGQYIFNVPNTMADARQYYYYFRAGVDCGGGGIIIWGVVLLTLWMPNYYLLLVD